MVGQPLRVGEYPLKPSLCNVAAQRLDDWLKAQQFLAIPEFKTWARMLRNLKPYIHNALDFPYSNGFTEAYINATKTLKRVAFGICNFRNFRARILLAADGHHSIRLRAA